MVVRTGVAGERGQIHRTLGQGEKGGIVAGVTSFSRD